MKYIDSKYIGSLESVHMLKIQIHSYNSILSSFKEGVHLLMLTVENLVIAWDMKDISVMMRVLPNVRRKAAVIY